MIDATSVAASRSISSPAARCDESWSTSIYFSVPAIAHLANRPTICQPAATVSAPLRREPAVTAAVWYRAWCALPCPLHAEVAVEPFRGTRAVQSCHDFTIRRVLKGSGFRDVFLGAVRAYEGNMESRSKCRVMGKGIGRINAEVDVEMYTRIGVWIL